MDLFAQICFCQHSVGNWGTYGYDAWHRAQKTNIILYQILGYIVPLSCSNLVRFVRWRIRRPAVAKMLWNYLIRLKW